MKWLLVLILLVKFNQPHIVAVDIGTVLPVQVMDGLTVPTSDNVLGLIDGYKATVFVAHDNLAGNHIKDIVSRGYAELIYSNGTKVKYQVDETELVQRGMPAKYEYDYDGLIFQTCEGDRILIIRMDK